MEWYNSINIDRILCEKYILLRQTTLRTRSMEPFCTNLFQLWFIQSINSNKLPYSPKWTSAHFLETWHLLLLWSRIGIGWPTDALWRGAVSKLTLFSVRVSTVVEGPFFLQIIYHVSTAGHFSNESLLQGDFNKHQLAVCWSTLLRHTRPGLYYTLKICRTAIILKTYSFCAVHVLVVVDNCVANRMPISLSVQKAGYTLQWSIGASW